MNFYNIKIKYLFYIFLGIYSFYVNYFFSNKGLFPIDTFSFFDTGYLITQGLHPIKDIWVISGIFIDYLQAIYFLLFGFNWNAYVFHASSLNMILCLFFFYFLNNFNKNFYINLLLSFSVATLCYPVAGTPFPYQHSFILSLISLMIFYLAIRKENRIYWLTLPIVMLLSFASMQMPSGIINVILLIFISLYYYKFEKFFLISFTCGVIFCVLLIIFYILIVKINLKDLLMQLVLFPFSLGEGRITGNSDSYASANLLKKFTIRGTFGHFKFIFFFIFANLISTIIYIKKKSNKFDKIVFLNFFIILCSLGFIFHQLITANQTFIFSLIPILCGLFIIQLNDFFKIKNRIINTSIILLITLITIKYHYDYNVDRKFMDLQNTDFSNSIKANTLDTKFNKLQWITPFYYKKNPSEELELLRKTKKIISKDKPEEIILITNYQFFSLLLEKKFNILNRWYFPKNNTHPTSKENKYYDYYLEKQQNLIIDKKIKKIYLVNSYPDEFSFISIKDLLKEKCYNKEKYNKMLTLIEIVSCN